MSTTATASGPDNQRSGLSGLVPAPIATTDDIPAQSSQTGSSSLPGVEGSGSGNNFIYIYSFLSTLFVLLCIAILVLLRALVRRRRLDALFNPEEESSNDTLQSAQQRQRQRRQKKRQQLGSKPTMSDVWIGNGPVSQSTEALLQPFSVARAPENEKKPLANDVAVPPFLDTVEREAERKSPYPPPPVLSFWQLPSSSSSCTVDNEKVAASSEAGHTSIGHQSPISPSSSAITAQMPLEQLRVGFLIAMPRPRVPGNNSTGWTDCDGEFPELSVGISNVYAPLDAPIVPVDADGPPTGPTPERERRRRGRRHIPIPPHMIDYP